MLLRSECKYLKTLLIIAVLFFVVVISSCSKKDEDKVLVFEGTVNQVYDSEMLTDSDADAFCEQYAVYEDPFIEYVDGVKYTDVLITSVAHDAEGVSYATGIKDYGDGHAWLYIIEDGKEQECIRIDNVMDNTMCFVFGTEHGFDGIRLFKEGVLYSFDRSTTTCTPELDLNVAGIELYRAPIVRDGGDYLLMGSAGDLFSDEDSQFGLWSITPHVLANERQTIKLGMCRDDIEWIDDAVSEFNRTNEEYVIEVVHYEDDPLTMRTDVLMSEGPDILVYDNEYRSELEGSGLFSDLDTIVTDTDRFFPNLWDSCKTSDGERLWVTPYVTVVNLFAMPGTIDDSMNFETISDLGNYIVSHPGYEHILRGDTEAVLIYEFLPFLLHKAYTDHELSQEDVMSLLDFCSRHGTAPYTETSGVAVQMADGELMFLEVYGGIGSFLQYVLTNEYTGGDIDYVGYPYTASLMFNSNMFISVMNNCNDPDGAAEVLNYLLSDEVLTSDIGNSIRQLPISQAACEKNIDSILGYYEDNRITDLGLHFSNNTGSGEMSLPVMLQSTGDGDVYSEPRYDPDNVYRREYGPAGRMLIDNPEDYIDDYYEFIASADGMLIYDQGVMNICNEELGGYYDGSRSAEDVSSVISSRAQIYIEEKG